MRIEHENWACEHCDARGWCPECSGLGTREAYHATQELHGYAICDEDGIAAWVLESIAAMPDLRERSYLVGKLIQYALRQSRMEVN